ncbi:MAG TPA: VapC toxin family PIN domain ribonuclease [Actinobacteria bacterium]|jgi:predicted nucleic acid-binding protein|nr:VapC toxin family PIN domain ribonuclease [Actinomycetota bacterium]
MADEPVVVDASAIIDLVIGATRAAAIGRRIDGRTLCAPAHVDAEVLSALGQLYRAGQLPAREVTRRLDIARDMPIQRFPLRDLVMGAWRRRKQLRLADALYVELAVRLGLRLVTTDAALGRASHVAEVIGP